MISLKHIALITGVGVILGGCSLLNQVKNAINTTGIDETKTTTSVVASPTPMATTQNDDVESIQKDADLLSIESDFNALVK